MRKDESTNDIAKVKVGKMNDFLVFEKLSIGNFF